jgi:hypothetical protein
MSVVERFGTLAIASFIIHYSVMPFSPLVEQASPSRAASTREEKSLASLETVLGPGPSDDCNVVVYRVVQVEAARVSFTMSRVVSRRTPITTSGAVIMGEAPTQEKQSKDAAVENWSLRWWATTVLVRMSN